MLIGYARASLERQPIDRQIDELTAAGVAASDIYSETSRAPAATGRS